MTVYPGYLGTPLQRFWSKILVTEDGCWLWQGPLSPDGYAKFRPVTREPMQKVHRWAYQMFIGEIPEDLELDHLCRHPHCANPNHLEAVTHQVNVFRSRTLACRNGHPRTPENVYEYVTGRGPIRVCRVCNREAQRRYQARKVRS